MRFVSRSLSAVAFGLLAVGTLAAAPATTTLTSGTPATPAPALAAPAFPKLPVASARFVAGSPALTLRADISGTDELWLTVGYGGDSYTADQAVWAEPTLYDHAGRATPLATLAPVSSQTGWGALLVNKALDNAPLAIGRQRYKTGFWAHGPSTIRFKLGGKYTRIETKVGLDPLSNHGSVTFHITAAPLPFPTLAEYTKNYGLHDKHGKPLATPLAARNASRRARPAPPPRVAAAAQTTFAFNPAAAKKLLDRGINELLFIRRPTLVSTHVYTDYVDSRWAPGGGLCALDLRTGTVREIVPQLTKDGVVAWFDLSFDAKKIVFDFKKSNREGYRIYEVNVDGTGLRQLTYPVADEATLVRTYGRYYHHGTDDMDPCYLPDGGIAFVSTRCQFGILCDSSDGLTVRNLHRMNADGTAIRPLSYSPLSEATPTVLPDGRILYHRWEYVDKAAGNCKALWAMNPDGSASAEVYGNTISFPETKVQARAIPGSPNKIVMLGASHWLTSALGSVIIVDTTKPLRSPTAMTYLTADVAAFGHDGFHFKNAAGKWAHSRDGKPGRLFRNPYPLAENLVLAARKSPGLPWQTRDGYDLVLLDAAGHDTPLLDDPAVSLWHPYPLTPRERPPVPVSSAIDEPLAARGLARCIVTDVYTGMENVQRGDVKYLRILEQLPRPWAARHNDNGDTHGMSHSAIGVGFLSAKIQHGIVPVETDGSAHFLVPAGRAIYFQALDKNYCAIQTERTYVNYNPGETRSCVGCHETPDMAPARSRLTAKPRALQRPASHPAPQPGQTDPRLAFDFERQIQPILDRHCVTCHDGKNKTLAPSRLDLRGTPSGRFNTAYHTLINLDRKTRLLGGERRFRNEDSGSNDISYIPPYRTGALTSPLAALIHGWPALPAATALAAPTLTNTAQEYSAEFARWNPRSDAHLAAANHLAAYTTKLHAAHKNLKLPPAAKLTLTNWLDLNCPYHPSYWGRKDARFQTRPDYRPLLTFDEYRSTTPPKFPAGVAAK
jgi:hypothetical protein